MKTFVICLFVAVLLSSCGSASSYPALVLAPTETSVPMSEMALTEGDLSILIPDSFKPISAEMKKVKYPREGAPNVIYTDDKGAVNITANQSSVSLLEKNLPALRSSMKKQYEQTFSGATWHKDELVSINGKSFFIFDLTVAAMDSRVRNIVLCTSRYNKMYMIGFNCVEELEGEWLAVGHKALMSVKFID